MSGFQNKMDWDFMKREAASITNRKQISKQKVKLNIEPFGHNFEVAVHFEQYCDENNQLYIYEGP